jgi:hypothetical protein
VSLRRRLLAAAAAALVLTGPIAAAVLSRVANTSTVPIAPDDRPDWTKIPVELLTVREGDRQHSLPMFAAAPGRLLRHPSVAILLATYGGKPTLDEAVLEWVDGRCSYRSAPGAVLENNQTIDLIKDPGCRADPGTHPAGIVRGTYVEEGERPRRIALLNYVWNIAADPTWIWVTLIVAGGLTVFSVLLLTGTAGAAAEHAEYTEGGWRTPARGERQTAASHALACASLALALGILYATFVPPFQAPDEPAHLLAFAEITGRTGMAQAAEALAKRGHLDRLRFHGDERFRPSDVGHPSPVPWGAEVFAHPVEGRSLTTFWWWKVTGGLTRGLTTPRTLLTARLANAVLFAVTIGVAVLLFATAAPVAGTRLPVPLLLLVVPTLPFFATHVAEFALVTDAYILLAASLCVLLADGPMAHRIGFPLGASMALALLSGRSAAPILPLFAAALAGRVVLGQRGGSRRATAIFWITCGAGLSLFPIFVSEAFKSGLWPRYTEESVATWFRLAAGVLRTYPSLLLATVPLGYGLERLFQRLPSSALGWSQRAIRAVGYTMAAAVVLSLAGSLIVRFPTLPTLEVASRPTAGAYVWDVLLVGLTSLRLAGPDLLLSSSFWGGFGWIDTVLPAGVVAVLAAIVATGVLLTGVSIVRHRDARHTVWILLLGSGGVAALAAYAVSNYFLNRNLHGRYLVGLYICTLLAAWTIPILSEARPKMPVRLLVIGTVVAIHAYALPFVLLRYF